MGTGNSQHLLDADVHTEANLSSVGISTLPRPSKFVSGGEQKDGLRVL
jgi:hypothetical protein